MQALVTLGPTYNLRHIRKANIAWKSEIYARLQKLNASVLLRNYFLPWSLRFG